MSELPQIDPLKAATREIAKLATEVDGYRKRESQLEILAEAIRDQRDEALEALEELRSKLQQANPDVHDITSLPEQ